MLYHERRSPVLAVRHFEAAIAARPRYAEAYNNLGAALAELGDNARALGCFRRAADLAPDFVEARINAAITRQGAGFHDDARRVLDEAAGPAPDDPRHRLEPVHGGPGERLSIGRAPAEARAQYRERLVALAARAAGGHARTAIDRCIGLVQPFLLPYQWRGRPGAAVDVR
ncbi:MAG: tetratricopeptide repeat protein [Gammaproteobacteria bacterium]|nr:tetratricopeptide repeat protein [Gammaproteobacteria bacterium]